MTTSGRPPVALAADSPSPSARRAADERRAHLDAAAYVEAHDLERVLADALRHVHRVCASPAAPPRDRDPPNPNRHIEVAAAYFQTLAAGRHVVGREWARVTATTRDRAAFSVAARDALTTLPPCDARGWRDALATLCPDVPREAVDRAHARCVRREEQRGDEATGRPPVGDGSEDAESAASSVSVTPAAFCDAFRDEIRSVADPTADATGSPESDAFAAHEARIRRFADATRRREAEAEAARAARAAREARARARADGRDARGRRGRGAPPRPAPLGSSEETDTNRRRRGRGRVDAGAGAGGGVVGGRGERRRRGRDENDGGSPHSSNSS